MRVIPKFDAEKGKWCRRGSQTKPISAEAVSDILDHTKGNRKTASLLMGMSEAQLNRLIERYELVS
jgi:DNA-binding protein Fis